MIRCYKKYILLCALALCLLVTAACAADPADERVQDSPFGHAYAVEAAPYENGMFGGGYYTGSTETCYRISPDGSLLILYSGDDGRLPVGTFTEITLAEANFDNYINDPIGAEMRQNNKKSWRLDANRIDCDFYYLLLQTDGTLFLSYGYDSEEIRLIRWVRQLRETADFPTDLYGAYVPNGCLYMNPLSSTLAAGGDDLCWSPLDENGVPVDSAAISFTLQNGDAPTTGGTLYIDRFNKGTGRDPLYTARIVGAGLTLDRYTDTAYAVVRAN